jgi:hypothetical protein
MTQKRFPQDWVAAELLKQYLRNHHCYAFKKSRLIVDTSDDLPNIEDENENGQD